MRCHRSGDRGQRSLAVRIFPDTNVLQVNVVKSDWAIPRGVPLSIRLQFDGGAPWATDDARGSGMGLGFHIRAERAVDFLAQFAASSFGVIQFGGTEPAWSINLTGSQSAVRAMLACVRRAEGSEQPYGGPTQPFSAGPAVPSRRTQPFSAAPSESAAPPTGVGRERNL